MNQDVDFTFLLPEGNIFPKTLYRTDRFKHIFQEAQNDFSLGNIEQGK